MTVNLSLALHFVIQRKPEAPALVKLSSAFDCLKVKKWRHTLHPHKVPATNPVSSLQILYSLQIL